MQILPTLVEALKADGLLKEIYGDLAKPGVRQVGIAIEALLGLGNTILWPVHLLNARAKFVLEANLEKFRTKLSNTENDKILSVPPEIGVPILERFTSTTNEELQDLYTNLLANASKQETVSLVHPSFVTILNNITPDEALLLKFLKKNHQINFQFQNAHGIQSVGFDLNVTTGLTFPTNLFAYTSNLEGLGVVKLSHKEIVAPQIGLSPNYDETGNATVTNYGKLFLSACVTDQ